MSDVKEQPLPPGWRLTVLGSILEVIRGVTYRKQDSRKEPGQGLVPMVRAINIQEHLVFDDLVYVPAPNVSQSQLLQSGDVVVAASSGSRGIVGKAAQLHQVWKGTFGAFCFVLRPEPPIEARLLGWFLHTKEYRNRVSEASAGVNINNLRREHIESVPFKVAPYPEQQRIADVLDELLSDLDAGVAALQRVREKLELYRAVVLKGALEGMLTAEWRKMHPSSEPASDLLKRILVERHRQWEQKESSKFRGKGKEARKTWKATYKEPVVPDTAALPPLPEGWCWASVDQLTSLVTSGSRGWKEYYSTDGALFIRSQDIRTDRLNLADVARVSPPKNAEGKRTQVQHGDVLITITGANVAKAAHVDVELPGAYVSQHVGLIRFVAHELGRFAHVNAVAPSGGRKRLLTLAYGAGKPGLNLDNLRALPMPLPPLAEQEALVEGVEDQLSVIAHLETNLEAHVKSAQALRQAILRHAFAGKLVPQDPKDEPASELLKRIAVEREARVREGTAKPRKDRSYGRRAAQGRRSQKVNQEKGH